MSSATTTVRDMSAVDEFEVEVICPGMLEILSVGRGDIKISLDHNNPEDVENARKLIEELLTKGYGVFVETDKGLSRVRKFNPKRMTYSIMEFVDQIDDAPAPAAAKPGRKPRTREREIPVAGSKTKAIGRTAGG